MTGPDLESLDLAHDRAVLTRVALIVALCLVLASIMPSGLIVATLSSLLTLAGFSTGFLASILRDPMWPPHLTRWDQAAILLVLGMATGWAVDPVALAQTLAAEGALR